MQKKPKNDSFDKGNRRRMSLVSLALCASKSFFKSDLGSAVILTGCGIAGSEDNSRAMEIARKILIFPQAHKTYCLQFYFDYVK